MSVANQKIVRIGKRVARDPTHLYAKINIDAMQYAYATLSRSGLGLWLYFNKNQDDYQLELSQKACAEWGIKKDSYYNGVNELIRFGFLVPISEGSNIYTFYETPLSEIANSHSPKSFSVSPQSMSKKQNDFSEKQERNITTKTVNVACMDCNMQRVLVALQCLCSELSASAINHELINLIFDA